jgi:hypothetical protein
MVSRRTFLCFLVSCSAVLGALRSFQAAKLMPEPALEPDLVLYKGWILRKDDLVA